MSAKDAMSESAEAKRPRGSGTRVSGYVEDPTPKKCGTCEYLVKGRLCNNKTVLTDKQVKKDPKSKLKVVDPTIGCCDFWEPKED